MNGRRALSILTLIVLTTALAPAMAAVAPKPAARAARPAGAAAPRAESPAVARVGPGAITRAELDGRTQQALLEFRQRNGNRELPADMQDMLRRQVLEGVIRMELLGLEAQRTGEAGSADEAEDEIKKMPVFNPGGHFDPARYATIKSTQPDAFKAAAAGVQKQLGARKLYAKLGARYMPTEAESRGIALRQLTSATLDHLSLHLSEFNGAYPEPRERDVLEAYRSHLADWQRPGRATITVAFVNSPGLPDSAAAVPGAKSAWTSRMRDVADGIVARLRAGASFDSVTAGLGEHANVVVTEDNFPAYWHGGGPERAKVFDPHQVGKAILEPIAAEEGWLLVRVDEVIPPHVAPLREVAREIRSQLRRDQRLHHDENEERGLFGKIRDSLAAPGWKLRYAAVDTSTLVREPPGEAELDRWFRGHLADYSSFDSRTGAIVERPFAEVRDDVRGRYLRERRLQEGRALTDELLGAWTHGQRLPAVESRLGVRETPALVALSVIDTGAVAHTLGDTLWNMPQEPSGAGAVPWARGWIVWQVVEKVARALPTFEQAKPLLAARLQAARDAEDLAGARRVFDADSMRFNQGDVVHFTALIVPPPDLLTVPLTRAEVEKYHHDHVDKYSAPELVTARHILLRPADSSPAADRAALARARDVLARVRAGEDFGALARQFSDDVSTRDDGGDLGAFGRGAMLEPFERAAFKLSAGDVSPEPVRTTLGYHIIKCVDHVAAYVTDLKLAYSVVSSDAAHDKAEVIAHERADSLLHVAPTPAALRAAAARLGIAPIVLAWQAGREMTNPARKPLYDEIVRMQPGQIHRPPFYVKGDGYWIAWVDSITPPEPPTWEQAQPRVLNDYRRGAGRRSLDAKKAELDSMFAAGWSLDSLAALWAGPERVSALTVGHGLPTMGNTAAFDSLVFGGRRSEGMAPGQESGWLMLPQGWTRIRLVQRDSPPAEQVAQRANVIRNAELERQLRAYFEDLKKRWPVKILDPTLRDISLAEPPPGVSP